VVLYLSDYIPEKAEVKIMKFLRITLILLTLGAICALSLSCGSSTETAQQTATVKRGNISTQITSVGNLEYSETKNLAFTIDCTISDVLVKAGDTVKQGQILCRFDETNWQSAIKTLADNSTYAMQNLTSKKVAVIQAEQDVASSQSGLVAANNTIISMQIAYLQAQLDLETAKTDLEKTKNATSDPIKVQMAQLDVDLAQGELTIALTNLNNATSYGMQAAQASVDNAQAVLTNAQAAVEAAQADSDDTYQILTTAKNAGPQFLSTADGLITTVNVVNNQDVISDEVGFVVANPSKFEASIMVSEQNISKVKTGESATIQVEVLSGVTLPAIVSSVSPTATISSSIVNYEVKVELLSTSSSTANQTLPGNFPTSGNASTSGPPSGGSGNFSGSGNLTQEQLEQMQQNMQASRTALSSVTLAQGMTVTVSITTSQATNVLMVNTQAITSAGGQTTVQVLVNSVVETRQVQTGISNSSYTEITSGLSEGDVVVLPNSSSSSSSSSSTPQVPGGGLFFGG
jgi:multidrug resistance efflux pump